MSLVKDAYNGLLRPRLPRSWTVYAGVPVRDAGLLDVNPHEPSYKQNLIAALYSHIENGDRVSIVGAGRGVTAVHTLRAGAGHVVGYEAAAEMVSLARETLTAQSLGADIQHALVGPAVDVYGDSSDAERVAPSELSCDVLLLDCEGAEATICSELESWPRVTIVETHPEHGVDVDDIDAPADANVSIRPYGDDSDKRVVVVIR